MKAEKEKTSLAGRLRALEPECSRYILRKTEAQPNGVKPSVVIATVSRLRCDEGMRFSTRTNPWYTIVTKL